MLQRASLLLRRSRWGGLPTRLLLLSLLIAVFCIVLLPSIIFPIAGLYLLWSLPLRKKGTFYAACIYLIAALAALWWLELAMSDRGIDYYGSGYIGVIPSLALTIITAMLLIANFLGRDGPARPELREGQEG
jgi:hypothetical protein